MDDDKKVLDELFQYGNKILSELKDASEKKSADLANLQARHEKLRQRLKNLYDSTNE